MYSLCVPLGYTQEVPMVIVSHDREFLDNLCTKIVETERGVATTYKVRGTSSGVLTPFTVTVTWFRIGLNTT
jgi:ABC-type polysaccharide/polyol phosphate transport system ATPase subunit